MSAYSFEFIAASKKAATDAVLACADLVTAFPRAHADVICAAIERLDLSRPPDPLETQISRGIRYGIKVTYNYLAPREISDLVASKMGLGIIERLEIYVDREPIIMGLEYDSPNEIGE